MKFSIIVPVYNSANFLPDCLAGVKIKALMIGSLFLLTTAQPTEAEQFLTGTPVPTIEFMFFIRRTAVSFSQEKKALQCLKANIFSSSTATTV